MQQLINLIALQQQVYLANKEKGFWKDLENRNKEEALALINSELYEGLEGHRKGRDAKMNLLSLFDDESIKTIYSREIDTMDFKQFMEDHIKDTWQDELADAVIRVLDYTGGFGIKLIDGSASVGEALPANFGAAILKINMRINGVFTAINSDYRKVGWSY